MNGKSLSFRYTAYWCAVCALTLALTLLRSIAFFTGFDADIGYFSPALSTVMDILIALGAAGCFSLLFFIKKDELPTAAAPLSLAGMIAAGTVTVSLITVAVSLVARIVERSGDLNTMTAPLGLMIPAACLALLAAPYFVLQLLGKPKLAPLFGYAMILAAVLFLSVTYFDRYTPMNAPHKISLHLSMLAIMVYMLYELRALLEQARPRALTVVSAIALLITATTGSSDLIGYVGNKVNDPLYLAGDLLALSMAFYIAMRAVSQILALHSAAERQVKEAVKAEVQTEAETNIKREVSAE